MKTKLLYFFMLPALFTLSTLQVSTACAQGTAFMYQGQLQNNGSPASGTYNITFTLFTNSTGGIAIAGPVTNNAVNVTNGLFTVLVDFGSGAFTGTSNWLEVAVETNGDASFTILSPLQQVTPAPYAIYSVNAGSAASATMATSATTATTANNFSGALAGDVTGTQGATVVSSVGGQTAANVASGASTANAATSANTVSTIVARDASGSFSAGSVNLNGNETLAATTASAGVIYAGGRTLMHSYGLYDFFAGSGAGNLTLTGSANTGLGSNALHSVTTAFDNTAVGHDSLMGNTSGSDNTATGGDTLEANTTGGNNSVYGAGALQYNITGGNNSAFGKQSLYNNTTGNNNTAYGYQGIYTYTNSSDNTAIGYQALYKTSGNNNVALGYQAGYNLTNGSSNIDIGNMGVATDTNIIRIGSGQSQTFIAGVVNGNGSGLTNLSANAITGGITTNILVGGHTLYFTNGILMNYQ